MNKDLHFSSKSNEWRTPINLFNILNNEFQFDLDAAANEYNALCENFFTEEDDALNQDWSKFKCVYVNPPYSRIGPKFIEKAYNESQKGVVVVMLVPSRTDTKYWHKYCAKAECRFLQGRVKFVDPENEEQANSAPFPSAVVIFKPNQEPKTLYIKL